MPLSTTNCTPQPTNESYKPNHFREKEINESKPEADFPAIVSSGSGRLLGEWRQQLIAISSKLRLNDRRRDDGHDVAEHDAQDKHFGGRAERLKRYDRSANHDEVDNRPGEHVGNAGADRQPLAKSRRMTGTMPHSHIGNKQPESGADADGQDRPAAEPSRR